MQRAHQNGNKKSQPKYHTTLTDVCLIYAPRVYEEVKTKLFAKIAEQILSYRMAVSDRSLKYKLNVKIQKRQNPEAGCIEI